MAGIDTLLDFDSPSLQATHQSSSFATANVSSDSMMDPFSVNYEVCFSSSYLSSYVLISTYQYFIMQCTVLWCLCRTLVL